MTSQQKAKKAQKKCLEVLANLKKVTGNQPPLRRTYDLFLPDLKDNFTKLKYSLRKVFNGSSKEKKIEPLIWPAKLNDQIESLLGATERYLSLLIDEKKPDPISTRHRYKTFVPLIDGLIKQLEISYAANAKRKLVENLTPTKWDLTPADVLKKVEAIKARR